MNKGRWAWFGCFPVNVISWATIQVLGITNTVALGPTCGLHSYWKKIGIDKMPKKETGNCLPMSNVWKCPTCGERLDREWGSFGWLGPCLPQLNLGRRRGKYLPEVWHLFPAIFMHKCCLFGCYLMCWCQIWCLFRMQITYKTYLYNVYICIYKH